MASLRKNHFLVVALLATCALFAFALGLVATGAAAAGLRSDQQEIPGQVNAEAGEIYLPVAVTNHPYFSPFGAESNDRWFEGSNIYNKGLDLNLKWTRMGQRISWRKLQPVEGGPIDWTKLAKFENELRDLKAAGITPVVMISDSPYWATVKPTSCAAIKTDKFPAFESFVRALVNRYKAPEFNVHDWEIGNEPDVAPGLVKQDSVFGCWGDFADPYYGGGHYGEMLKAITPAIKQVDQDAKVWFGGLLLASPDSENGKPELFLQGALEAGAGPFFDILGYHWYPPYLNQTVDYDLLGRWNDLGGGTAGKARFLRDIMDEYGVSKPLVLNETSLMCPPTVGGQFTNYCDPPSSNFFQNQADYLVRSYVRGLSVNLLGFSWYTLNGPGWRNTGLLNAQGEPRPSYHAMKNMIAQLNRTRFLDPVSYGAGVEAYAFHRGTDRVHVVWAIENNTKTVSVPKAKFIAAYGRDGNQLTPTLSGDSYTLNVGFRPVYIIRKP